MLTGPAGTGKTFVLNQFIKLAKYEGKPKGQKKKEVGAAVPFGRMGTAEDLTGMAIFLATPEAKYIVAQCFGVDGGNWMA